MRQPVAVAALMFSISLPGCSDVVAPSMEPVPLTVRLDSRVVEAYTSFGFELFRRLHDDATDSNLVVSPTSAAFALSMTYNGAAGETRDAMARTLGVTDLSLEELNRANEEWLAALSSTGDSKVQLSLANSLWAKQGFPFLADFMQRNRSFYDAQITELPFDAAALNAINGWAATQTKGKIETILDEVSPNAVLYLLNALYFKAEWSQRFDPAMTKDEPFTRADGSQVTVPLMRQTITARYHRNHDVELVSLPYGNGRFSMVLALPETELADFNARLDAGAWEGWIEQMQETNLTVVLPRFRIDWGDSLVPTLKAMGMEVAFSPHLADFSAMTPGGGLYISKVKQKTFIEVDEKGTEAAAVTLVEMGRTSTGIPTIRFDRPFFFALRDNATGTLLFLGSVADPVSRG